METGTQEKELENPIPGHLYLTFDNGKQRITTVTNSEGRSISVVVNPFFDAVIIKLIEECKPKLGTNLTLLHREHIKKQ